jgi:uncharacterized protein (TIGR00730 family)
MPTLHRICVFCGSSPGSRPEYAETARSLARELVSRGIELVYGGGRVGLMGEIAREAMRTGGRVTGIIPRALVEKELAFTAVSDLRIVGSMHERKALMSELSDAFIALPGGLGTIEELFEVLTWSQLGIHRKPCGLLNSAGYYDRLSGFLDHAVTQGFVQPSHREMIFMEESPGALIERFLTYEPPTVDKARWLLDQGLPPVSA